MTTVHIMVDEMTAREGDYCELACHLAHILHAPGACQQYPTLRVDRVARCDVCDQVWDSDRHSRCAILYADGGRRYADPVRYGALDGETVIIGMATP